MLFSEIAYGPIHSRRLGVSLGMELMPLEHKLCTFNCVYCECGWNSPVVHPKLPARGEVHQALEKKLLALQAEGTRLDVITFSGNGEPTLHPDFAGIIDDTLALRDRYQPQAKVSVLQIERWLMQFDGDFTLQTCFLRGEHAGQRIDNTTQEELQAWYASVDRLHPRQIMIYVIDRKTPEENLQKIPREEMERIAQPLREKGFNIIISA